MVFIRNNIKESIFGTDEFKALTTHGKAAFIFDHVAEIEKLSTPALETMATVLVKSSCHCQFHELVTDESTGDQFVIERRKHDRTCPTVRNPVLEDYSVRQLQRRQRAELPYDHQHLVMIEEVSSRVRKAEKHNG